MFHITTNNSLQKLITCAYAQLRSRNDRCCVCSEHLLGDSCIIQRVQEHMSLYGLQPFFPFTALMRRRWGGGNGPRRGNAMLISPIAAALRHFTTCPLMRVQSTIAQYWRHYERGGGIPAVKEGSISGRGRAEQHPVHHHNEASFILHSPHQFVPHL